VTDRPRALLACDFLVKYTSGLAGGLAEIGWDPLLLTRDHDFEFASAPGAMEAWIRDHHGDRIRHLQLEGRASDPRTFPAVVRARRARRAFAPGVVHLQNTVTDDPRLLAVAGLDSSRLCFTIHDVGPHPGDPEAAWWRWKLDRWLIRRSRVVFLHAESLAEEAIEKYRPPGAVVAVPHGIDPPDPQPLPEHPTLLFFGRISHYKGLDVLLDAMPAVWAAVPDAHLIVAGAGELPAHPVLEDARVEIRNAHVPDADLPALFARSTAAVLPYREASQSGVGSVAKRYGRAAVLTSVGGLPELAADGSSLVVAPEDPAALAGAALTLLRSPERAREMGLAAATTAAEGASWRAVAEITADAYERHVLGRRGPRRPAVTSAGGAA
jgi:glycosyltransferase involved in cell wall biosynthesis